MKMMNRARVGRTCEKARMDKEVFATLKIRGKNRPTSVVLN